MASSESFPPVKAVVTFVCGRDSLALQVPAPVDSQHDPRAQMAAGTVVEVKPMAPHGPGKIPTAAVTVKGRSGRKVTIDGAACFLAVRESWDEALKACEAFNRSTARNVTAPGKPTR